MTLHLVRLRVDLAALARAAGDRGWARGRNASFDEGAALHHLLGETFGPAALQPFRLMVAPRAGNARLYGYSQKTPDELRDTAAMTASPEVEAAIDPAKLEGKPMPQVFEVGRRIGFDLRLRPVVRLARDVASPPDRTGVREHGFRKGAEVDAFLAEALHDGDRTAMAAAGRPREAVYRDWLTARLDAAASLDDARVVSFRRTRAVRNGRETEGPDAVMQGTCTVAEADAFERLLAGGVGRHKAYGYGMLLLRPPWSPAPGS